MFEIRDQRAEVPTLVLADTAAGSVVTVAPERGGMVTGFAVGGRELLYLDRESFEDRGKNVRGGNPVLFPSPGMLTDGRFSRDGQSGLMKQHGFGRTMAWAVAARSTEGAASVTLELVSDATTLAQFPWEFVARYNYSLRGARLEILMEVENRDGKVLPCGLGFHPYFRVPAADKGAMEIETGATRAWDNVAKAEVAFSGFALGSGEVDLHLQDHGSTVCAMRWPGLGGLVRLEGSAAFTHWVVWTLQGRDFVCVEPWTCPGDALNTGERLMMVGPGEVARASVAFVYEAD